jgi:transposase
MENRDARTLTQDAQHEIRRQAIKLHLKGFGPSRNAEDLDVHRNAVSGWINRYKEGGMKALKMAHPQNLWAVSKFATDIL